MQGLTSIITVSLLALAPGIFWGWVFWRQVRGKDISLKIPVLLFFTGILMLPIAAGIEYLFQCNRVVSLGIVVPLVEETCKFAAMYMVAGRFLKKASAVRGTGYAVATSLGFATAENVYLVLSAYLVPQVALGQNDPVFAFGLVWKLYLLRAVFTVPSHALWSSFWGYALGAEGAVNRRVFLAIAVSICLHGLFNLMVLNFPPGAIIMILVFMVLWIIFYMLVQ